MDSSLHDRLSVAAAALGETTGQKAHDIVVVLGSGLGGYSEQFPDAVTVPYRDLPGFPIPGAAGHVGSATSVLFGENRVLLYGGRAHVYEGYDLDQVCFAVRAAVVHGCKTVVLTNAAGGMGDGLVPGDLVVMTDHLNMAGLSPLRGHNDARLGERHPDMTDVYTPALQAVAAEVAEAVDVELKSGIYAWWQGPMFETPAEIRMLRMLGADLVGMSTVPEATAARHLGADVLAISLCTNLAAGMSGQRLSAQEVIDEGARAATRFGRLMNSLLHRLV